MLHRADIKVSKTGKPIWQDVQEAKWASDYGQDELVEFMGGETLFDQCEVISLDDKDLRRFLETPGAWPEVLLSCNF